MITIFKTFKKLNEKVLFSHGDINFYLNPPTTIKFNKFSRGVVTIDGDIFIIDDDWNYIHSGIFEILKNKGYLKYPNLHNLWTDISYTLNYIVPVQKSGREDKLFLSESFNDKEIKENYNKIIRIFKAAKEKNPKFTFVVYPSILDNDDNDYFDEYQKLYIEI